MTMVSSNSTTPTTYNSNRKLVIHFDVNETIIMEDIAGGDSVDDCLNKILAKNALVQKTKYGTSPIFWWDGTKISGSDWKQRQSDTPPALFPGWESPLGCETYYKACKSKSKTFTSHDGAIYQSILEDMRRNLSFNNHGTTNTNCDGSIIDHRLTKDGGKTHFILPAFFESLYRLEQSKRDYTVVLRTFGSDLPLVADAIQAFAEGKHPLYPSFFSQTLRLPKDNMFRGRYYNKHVKRQVECCDVEGDTVVDDGSPVTSYNLHEWTTDVDPNNDNDLLGRVVAQNDNEILSILEQHCNVKGGKGEYYKVFGINDDYHFWSQNKFNPSFGKPMWVHCDDNTCTASSEKLSPLHIFFDDNIKNDAQNNIVAVRYQNSSSSNKGFSTLCGEKIVALHGRYLVRVPTYMPILQPTWFLQQIDQCERNLVNNPFVPSSD